MAKPFPPKAKKGHMIPGTHSPYPADVPLYPEAATPVSGQ